jgi:hypothetical protein
VCSTGKSVNKVFLLWSRSRLFGCSVDEANRVCSAAASCCVCVQMQEKVHAVAHALKESIDLLVPLFPSGENQLREFCYAHT